MIIRHKRIAIAGSETGSEQLLCEITFGLRGRQLSRQGGGRWAQGAQLRQGGGRAGRIGANLPRAGRREVRREGSREVDVSTRKKKERRTIERVFGEGKKPALPRSHEGHERTPSIIHKTTSYAPIARPSCHCAARLVLLFHP